MELTLERKRYTRQSTIGWLFVDGVRVCHTLEDVVRPKGVKIDKRTAIPAGRYRVVVDHSTRFGRDMIHVLDVPMFSGIRLHMGNTAADTEGCILVGERAGVDAISNCHAVYESIFGMVVDELSYNKPVWLTVVDAPSPDSPLRPPVESEVTA